MSFIYRCSYIPFSIIINFFMKSLSIEKYSCNLANKILLAASPTGSVK